MPSRFSFGPRALSATLICTVLAPALAQPEPAPGPAFELAPGLRVQNRRDAFNYFSNPWAVIGLKDYPEATKVSPEFGLVLADGLTVRPLVGESLVPFDLRVKQLPGNCAAPIVTAGLVLNGSTSLDLSAFACPLDGQESSFDWPATDNYLNVLHFSGTNPSEDLHLGIEWLSKSGQPLDLTLEPVDQATLRLVHNGRLAALLKGLRGARASIEKGRLRVVWERSTDGTFAWSAYIPFRPLDDPAAASAQLVSFDRDRLERDTADFWRKLKDRGVGLAIEESKVACTYGASMAYQFIGRDKGELHAGEGFYDRLYIRDAAYQAISLAHAGYLEEARRGLEPFLAHQHENGQFWTQKGQLDANGYAIWAFVEYYLLSGDGEWLRRVYPNIQRSADWIRQTRRTEKDPASPFYGILPAALADGENLWDGKHHIIGYDWWNLRGIQCAAVAAEALGLQQDAAEYRREFEDYRSSILKALDRTGLKYIPPSYEKAGTHWGNLEGVFPTQLIDPRDPRVGATLRLVREEFGAEGGPRGFVEGIIQWSPGVHKQPAIHPYMSQFVTNTHIIRGEREQALDGFYSFLLHTTSTHGFPEGVHYEKREAWNNTLPHLWAAALYVTTLRNMLVREEGETLHLLSCVPDHWLIRSHLRLTGAPIHFGTVSFDATTDRGVTRLEFTPKWRRRPAHLVIHAPVGKRIVLARAGERTLSVQNGTAVRADEALMDGGVIVLETPGDDLKGSAMTFEARVEAFKRAVTKPAQ